jgi:hypothetical protein
MHEDEDEDEGDKGGQGTSLAVPIFRSVPERLRKGARSTDIAPQPVKAVVQPKIDVTSFMRKLRDRRRLPNGYTIGYFNKEWFLFDKRNKFLGRFDTEEKALRAALPKDDPSPPPFGM